MSLAIVEQIAQVIQTRIETLLVDERISKVYRPRRNDEEQTEDRSVVIKQQPPIEVPELALPGNPPRDCFETVFELRCVVCDEVDDDPIDARMAELTAEVKKAVSLNSSSDWYSFGGLAVWAKFTSQEEIADAAQVTHKLMLPVRYRHQEGDPTAL